MFLKAKAKAKCKSKGLYTLSYHKKNKTLKTLNVVFNVTIKNPEYK